MNRGSAVQYLQPLGIAPASMRPRFMNRGSTLATARTQTYRSASMRPRFMNRGSPLAYVPRLGVTALQ